MIIVFQRNCTLPRPTRPQHDVPPCAAPLRSHSSWLSPSSQSIRPPRI